MVIWLPTVKNENALVIALWYENYEACTVQLNVLLKYMELWLTALCNNMQTLLMQQCQSFAAFSHLSRPLRKQTFPSKGSSLKLVGYHCKDDWQQPKIQSLVFMVRVLGFMRGSVSDLHDNWLFTFSLILSFLWREKVYSVVF